MLLVWLFFRCVVSEILEVNAFPLITKTFKQDNTISLFHEMNKFYCRNPIVFVCLHELVDGLVLLHPNSMVAEKSNPTFSFCWHIILVVKIPSIEQIHIPLEDITHCMKYIDNPSEVKQMVLFQCNFFFQAC